MGRATLFTRMKIMTNLVDYLVLSNNKRKKILKYGSFLDLQKYTCLIPNLGRKTSKKITKYFHLS